MLVPALLAALALEPPVRPEPGVLDWSAPPSCPAADELRRGIERRLGRSLIAHDGAVEARVETKGEGYRLVLRTAAEGVQEERTLEADDCRTLVDATALIVAATIDPVAVAEASAPRAEPLVVPTPSRPTAPSTRPAVPSTRPAVPSTRSAAPSPRPASSSSSPSPSSSSSSSSSPSPSSAPRSPPSAELSSAPLPRRIPRPLGVLRAGLGGGVGAVPRGTGVAALAAGLRWTSARLEIEGTYWIPRRSVPVEGSRVRVQLGTAALRGCGLVGRPPLEVPLCSGLQLGGLRGNGIDALRARPAQGLWLALEAGAGLARRLGPRWSLAGGVTAALPLVTPAFELAGARPVRLFEPSAVVGRAWLGIERLLGSS
ncbi:MAG: hypothetical protein KDK70_07895 [Myxococcales bacterium]|nr:hypothetical protein [Myxococcales bacterium]